jgi:hypothetical protein
MMVACRIEDTETSHEGSAGADAIRSTALRYLQLCRLRRGEGAAPVAGPSPTLTGIDVTFMLDPRISRGIYLGDRWLSPPYLRVGEGEPVTVEARAYALDAAGQPTTIAPTWTPTDPGMVTVTPARGNEVGITVRGRREPPADHGAGRVQGAGHQGDLSKRRHPGGDL